MPALVLKARMALPKYHRFPAAAVSIGRAAAALANAAAPVATAGDMGPGSNRQSTLGTAGALIIANSWFTVVGTT